MCRARCESTIRRNYRRRCNRCITAMTRRLPRHMYHGDDATIAAVLTNLDGRLTQPLNLSDVEIGDLVAFLKSLTDPAARDLTALIPARVPSGLPVQE